MQGLVTARMALEVGDVETAATTIDRTLEAARKIVGELLRAGGPVEPGDLVRGQREEDV